MFTDPMNHAPAAPTCSRGWRRALPGILPVFAVAVLVPAAALAQDGLTAEQRLRTRDLSVIEDLLREGVQHAIQASVRTVNTTNRRAQEEAQGGDAQVIRYMFRSSGQTEARGMFLEDYGVIFTLQVPTLSYTFSTLFVGPADGNGFTVLTPDAMLAFEGAREVQLRNQISRMRAEVQSLTDRLAEEVEASGGTSATAQKLRASIAQIEQDYSAYVSDAERTEAIAEAAPTADEQPAGRNNRMSGLLRLSVADPEAMEQAKEIAEAQKIEVEGAVITSIIDTVASYGSVVHGLRPDDRLAVVLLPSSYLDRVGSWQRATRRAEEVVISARYADIQEIDAQLITPEEFGARIRVESRLGQSR